MGPAILPRNCDTWLYVCLGRKVLRGALELFLAMTPSCCCVDRCREFETRNTPPYVDIMSTSSVDPWTDFDRHRPDEKAGNQSS